MQSNMKEKKYMYENDNPCMNKRKDTSNEEQHKKKERKTFTFHISFYFTTNLHLYFLSHLIIPISLSTLRISKSCQQGSCRGSNGIRFPFSSFLK